MVIRRIRQHVARQNWFAVGIDLAIVVAGVFLGTQANNWNETRIKRAAAAESRREMIDDLKGNEADLISRAAYYRAARMHAVAALGALERPNEPRGERFLLDAYQASQVWLRPLVRTGYDEMTGSGLTRHIGDRETRSRLTNYYTNTRQFEITALGTTAYRERLRRAMPYKVQMAINRQCGDRVTYLADGSQIGALPDRCNLVLDKDTVTTALARVKGADLGEDLTRHIADIDQKLAGFERFGRLARELRLRLEAIERR
jgi:hypothetical protein